MDKLKVVKVTKDHIRFDNGVIIESIHDTDCCEEHYLSFEHLRLDDFDGLEFDLTNDDFFEKIDGFGIELKPVSGWSIRVPGYGNNNGWYTSDLFLQVRKGKIIIKDYDISECQKVNWY